MFRQYQLRRTSTTSGSRSPSMRPQSLGRGTSVGSSVASSAAFPTGALGSALPAAAHQAGSSSRSRNAAPSDRDLSSHDEPIFTSGMRRQREADDPEYDPTFLSPQRIKRLKVYAKKLCSERQVPDHSVLAFIDTGDLFLMLVDIKTTLVQYEQGNKINEHQTLQDLVSSKEFENGLHSRLLACVLSPNLTAYVIDTQRHIMEFIAQHLDVFKVPAGVFDDVELRSALGRLVTRILSTIRSQIKMQLTASIAKRTCIIDVTRGLARSSSGMEVEAPHWARMAFLRRCLRLYLIGSSDYRVVTAKDCFTPQMIPSLKADMRRKLEDELGININQLELTLPHVDMDIQLDEPNDGEGPACDDGQLPIPGAWQPATDDLDADADGVPDLDIPADGADELDEDDSGFGLDGHRVRFSATKFWNYVDYMLNLLRETVRKDNESKEDWDAAVAGVIILILQDDLVESPGNLKKSGKILSMANPQWQIAIQDGLVW